MCVTAIIHCIDISVNYKLIAPSRATDKDPVEIDVILLCMSCRANEMIRVKCAISSFACSLALLLRYASTRYIF